MSSEPFDSQWQMKKELFQTALELSPTQQEEFLITQIPVESIRAEVRQMLTLHRSDESFLRSPFDGQAYPVECGATADPYIGQSTGGFTIQGLLGLGGMGAVYLAWQDNPERKVALKILDQAQHQTEKRIRRFVHEIAVLARLDHPGIAKIYSAGAIDFGRGLQPWFAMELVSGETLSRFVELNQPELRHKVELLIQICEAVHHAHLRGVVHRDLKPSNILVSTHETSLQNDHGANERDVDSVFASTKIVDFGIARMTGDAGEQLTLDGEILGTLNYMSPEQFVGNQEQIDGRSDVFAIGMIGFEMLTGRLAYDRQGKSLSDIIARANFDSPTRLRQVQPSFSRDLDFIFAAALAPDRQRRYLSPLDLAHDLKRYLKGERPLVRKPSMSYRASRFVSLHRGLVFGTMATMAGLAIGLLFYANAARRANRNAEELKYEANKSQAINDFITNDLVMRFFGASENSKPKRDDISRLVDEASEKIEIMFRGQPTHEAAIRNEVGTIFYNLKRFDRAETEYQTAWKLWESQLGATHNDTLKAVNNLGQTCLAKGKLSEAESLLERAYRGRLTALGSDNTLTINSQINLAHLYMQTERISAAEKMFSEIVDRKTEWGQDSDKSILSAMSSLGAIHIKQGRVAEALLLHQRSFVIAQKHYGESHPATLSLAMRLAQTLHRMQRSEEAKTLIESCLPKLRESTGSDSLETVNGLRLLARIEQVQAEPDDAMKHLREAEKSLLESNRDLVLLKKVQSEISALEQPDR